jgi:hypothetical protein
MRALRPPGLRRPSAAFVVAAVALFVALGGPAEAQKLLSGSDIKKGTVTTRQIKDRSLEAKDLSAKARRTLTATPDGSVGDADLAAGAVTARAVADSSLTAADLGPSSVGTDELGDNAVGQAEIRNNGVGASEIADNSVDGGEIIDGGLRARDIARFSGTLEVRFKDPVPEHSCVLAPVSNVGSGADLSQDLMVVSASAAWPHSLSYHVRASRTPGSFDFVACNPTTVPIPLLAQVAFRYAVIAG